MYAQYIIEGDIMTINERINQLRYKLDESITQNKSYDEIYKLSSLLDELIILYYRREEYRCG